MTETATTGLATTSLEERRAALASTSVVIPVWGKYWRFIPDLLKQLLDEGVGLYNIFVISNAEDAPIHLDCPFIRNPEYVSIGQIRNNAMERIRTPFVVFCDADDKPVPGALAKLAMAISRDEGASVATGGVLRVNGEEYPWPKRRKSRGKIIDVARQIGWNNLSLTTGTIIRVTSFRKAGGFPDMRLAEDGALGCVLMWIGKVVDLGEATRIYNVHEDGLCQAGHDPGRWMRAYSGQRAWLRNNPALPWFIRKVVPLYKPYHHRMSQRLAEVARFTE